MDPRGLHPREDPAPVLADRSVRTLLTTEPRPTPQRRLRLSEHLLDLAEDAAPAVPPETAADGRPARATPSNITIGEILDRTTHSGFGFLIAFLALAAAPLPGVSSPFGIAIAFGGLQMVAGRDRPWLPERLRRHAVSMRTMRWLRDKVARWTRGLERAIRPRFAFAARGPFWIALGAGIVFQGLGLALPLPIPGSNWLFVVPILVYAIGLLEGDGLLVLVAHAITAIEIVLGIVFSRNIADAIAKAVERIASLFG